jgi:hypothetical protein
VVEHEDEVEQLVAVEQELEHADPGQSKLVENPYEGMVDESRLVKSCCDPTDTSGTAGTGTIHAKRIALPLY